MKRKVTKIGLLRLSPNEEAQLLKEEQDRRRRLRLQQVREQERHIALQIRKEVQHRRDLELKKLAEQLKADWELQQREQLEALKKVYEDSLQAVGEGHRGAKENEPDWETIARRAEENNEKAAERHREALKELKLRRQRQHEEQTRHIQARRRAVLAEKQRAAKVASLPPRPPDPIEKIETKTVPPVKMSSADGFSSTHYHLPETAVDREVDTTQPDAQVAAEEEARRLEELVREKEREKRERMEKARLRGAQALRKEHLNQDRECLLQQLSRMQQADLLRRRQQVALLPPHIFQPLYKRQEMREQRQRDLEIAFEDVYAGERRMKGDLALRLVPEPLPATSTGSQDEDLDVTMEPTAEEIADETIKPTAEEPIDETLKSTAREATDKIVELSVLEDVEPSQPAALSFLEKAEPEEERSRQVLKKLLDRIRAQRVQRGSRSVSEISTATVENMTIESGSLSNQEKESLHPEPFPSAQDHEMPAEPIMARVLERSTDQSEEVRRIEAERKKREEELERQKQEQITLLQQLEEQRRLLELHLQQAQLDKEQLQDRVVQDSGKGVQHHLPVQEQEVPPVGNMVHDAERAPQDEHSRKIREYQQRLLEQSRRHQQSVDDARRQLREYQRLLMTKYPSMAAEVARPIAPPPRGVSVPSIPSEVWPGLVAPVQKETTSQQSEASSGVITEHISHTHPALVAPSPERQLFFQGHRPAAPSQLTAQHLEARSVRMDAQPFLTIVGSEVVPEKPQGAFPSQDVDAAPAAQFPRGTSADQESGVLAGQELTRNTQELAQSLPAPPVEAEQTGTQLAMQSASFLRQQGAPENTLHYCQTQQEDSMGPALTEAQHSEKGRTQQLSLMSALLNAIEESDLGEVTPKDGSPMSLSSIRSREGQKESLNHQPVGSESFVPQKEQISRKGTHPRAPRPPLARARLGILDMIEQHELSAIQEAETPDSGSFATAGEVESGEVSSARLEEPGEWGHSVGSHSSKGQGLTAGGTVSGSSSRLTWRDHLHMEADWSRERDSAAVPVLMDIPCSWGLQQGAGLGKADGSLGGEQGRPSPGSIGGSSFPQGQHVDPDYLSSTTISTGTFSTEEPDLSAIGVAELHNGSGFMGLSPSHCGVSDESSLMSQKSETLLFNQSVQRIIDKYTNELKDSLSAAGSAAGNRDSGLGGPHSLTPPSEMVTQQNTLRSRCHVSKGRATVLHLDQTLAAQNLSKVWETLSDCSAYLQNGHRGHLSCGSVSESSFEGPHNSSSRFLPLEPRADISSSTYSSSSCHVGQQEQKRRGEQWDRAVSRIVELLSDQPSSPQPGEETGASVSLLIAQLLSQSSRWLDADGSLASESGGASSSQQSHTADESKVQSPGPQMINQDFLHPRQDGNGGIQRSEGPPLTQVSGANVQDLLTDLVSELHNSGSFYPISWLPPQGHLANEESLLNATSDSFHPLLAETTASAPLEHSTTIQGSRPCVPNVPSPLVELPSVGRPLKQPDPLWATKTSPEHLRAERLDLWQDAGAVLSDSTQITVHDSVLMSSAVIGEPGVSSPLVKDSHPGPDHQEDGSVQILEAPDPLQEPKEAGLPVWERIREESSGKGILEEPDLTLLSLADTTADQEEPSNTQAEGSKVPGGGCERQKSGDGASQLTKTTKRGECVSPGGTNKNSQDESEPSRAAVMLLEFHATPGHLQDLFLQKRQDFVHRSARRQEEVKARRREAASPRPSQPGSNAQGQRPSLRPQVTNTELKKVGEVKVCTPEQRKMEEAEMYQRTERLYNQLEEVRQRKEMKTRQESYARNREKAKEFQKKTLQKLRAKQTRH
ncbi:centrosomal protein of 295 kDa isoform X1 [Arapaima gigas]